MKNFILKISIATLVWCSYTSLLYAQRSDSVIYLIHREDFPLQDDTTVCCSECYCENDTGHFWLEINGVKRTDTTYRWHVLGVIYAGDTVSYFVDNQSELYIDVGEHGFNDCIFGGLYSIVNIEDLPLNPGNTGAGRSFIVIQCKPIAQIQAHPLVYCSHTTVTIKEASRRKPTQWRWYLNKDNAGYQLYSTDTTFKGFFSDTGFYQVKLEVENVKGRDSAFTSFRIIKGVEFIHDTLQTLFLNNTNQTELQACAIAEQYEWFPKENLSCSNCSVTNATIQADAAYYCVASNNNGCKDTCFYRIELPFDLFVPNAFSPNGDGVNDIFRVRGLNIEVQNCKIYNRYGNEIYNGTLENGWDGKYNNELVESGVYTYTLEYLNKKTDKVIRKHGILSIIR
jgi:gliding motility-associated-like protein